MEDETSLPPCGGSGLKLLAGAIAASLSASPSMRREWIEMQTVQTPQNPAGSPSMRREWIEILSEQYKKTSYPVSLHAEGVD